MRYITVIKGHEQEVTHDEQMWSCIDQGGEMFSIDDNGKRELIANADGFVRGRPVFPVYVDNIKSEGEVNP